MILALSSLVDQNCDEQGCHAETHTLKIKWEELAKPLFIL